MPSNITVSSDIDTLLRKSTKEEAATFLGLEDTKAQWGQITGTLTTQTDLVNALALKAPIASPTFTGTVLTPEIIVGNSSNVDNLKIDIGNGSARFIVTDGSGAGVGTFLRADINGSPNDEVSIDAAFGTLTLQADAGVKIGDDLHVAKFGAGTDDTKVGIRTTSPSSALDVNGTIKATDININSKGFFVGNGSNGDYLQAKDYGHGDFHDLAGATNQPKSIPAFGSGGKVVEKTLIKTFKLQGTGFTGLGTPVVLVTGVADKYIVPIEMSVYCDYGTRTGTFGTGNAGNSAIQIGTFQNQDDTPSGGGFAQWLAIPISTANTASDWLTRKSAPSMAQLKQFANRDLVLKSQHVPTSEANAPDGTWYIQLEYMILDEYESFENNVDSTIGTAF